MRAVKAATNSKQELQLLLQTQIDELSDPLMAEDVANVVQDAVKTFSRLHLGLQNDYDPDEVSLSPSLLHSLLPSLSPLIMFLSVTHTH